MQRDCQSLSDVTAKVQEFRNNNNSLQGVKAFCLLQVTDIDQLEAVDDLLASVPTDLETVLVFDKATTDAEIVANMN